MGPHTIGALYLDSAVETTFRVLLLITSYHSLFDFLLIYFQFITISNKLLCEGKGYAPLQ